MVSIARLFIVFSSLVVGGFVSCGGPAGPVGFVSLGGKCMGTTWSAVVDVQVAGDADRFADLIQGRLDAVDVAMSTWKDESDLSRFNRAARGVKTEVSELTVSMMKICGPLVAATGGAFDPTVGPLVRLWGFGSYDKVEAPSDEAIAQAMGFVNWPAVKVEGATMSKESDGVEVDVSAVAKGYAVDLAAEVLVEAGCDSFLLEVGGEMVLRGKNASGEPWRVGVIDPLPQLNQLLDTSYYAALSVTDRAVATSGDYRNVRRVNGRIVAHAIDPRTGRPIDHALASVTVVASTCAEADALATAALVLGPEAGLRMLEKQEGVEGYLLSRVGAGEDVTLAVDATSGMEAILSPPVPDSPGSR